VKADDKVKTLLAQVLRRCDSILEALGDNGGDRGGVVRGVGGGINTVGTGGDAAWNSAGDDDVGSALVEAGADLVLASDAAGGILTSTGAGANHRGTQSSVLTSAHNGIPSSGGEVVLLRDGGFEWSVGGALATRNRGVGTGAVGGVASDLLAGVIL
jgi:hypothetical protein